MAQVISGKLTNTHISTVGFTNNEDYVKHKKLTRYSLADTMDEAPRDYSIQVIKQEDKPEVLKFLRRFFFRDEPLNASIELIPRGENSTCVPLEEYSMSSIDENLSLKAVSSAGNIVGVQLNGTTVKPEDTDEPDFIKNCDNFKFKKILRLLHHVDRKAAVLDRYPGSKILDVKIISVDSGCRGKGIAAALCQKTVDIAKELNYNYIRTDASSHYTAKLCKRLGFEQIFELMYKDYVDSNGKSIFTPAYPHSCISTFIKKL
ncbi:GSCOCG00002594001-RA-CDS [Cotesia congregata]|uniref:aralkylamine N-acetyltransferase n=2 Tax=Cotesia congregata TaxID=51543 RepID=A0A8J2HLZ7_COTCN|nr:GSCOCG00002594001-RA-CDS [Cotesia congregata]CAG5101691.1 Similar to AANAT1: Dopamine N-acetyltransferase (Drosophila melanogaster) [Cotesia congregata]